MSPKENRPVPYHSSKALTLPQPRQVLNLSVAVAGTLGGALLLSSNVAVLVIAQISAIPWVPLTANAALLFGGLMFAREYRRGRGTDPREAR